MKNTADPLIDVSSLSPDALLEHSSWMRRLVGQLVRDVAQVDDLVQDAWAAALNNPPPKGVALRAWLAGIAKRTVLARGRGDARRRHREKDRTLEASRDGRDQAPSVAELSACAEEQRFLLGAVGDLPEEQTAVLLLRFYEDLPPREIAKRLDVPVNTVRTRQRLGVERLRSQLDQRHGANSSAWATVLLPLAAVGGRGGAIVGTAVAAATVEEVAGLGSGSLFRFLSAGFLLLAASGVGWWLLSDDEAPDLSQITTPEVALATIFDARSRVPAPDASEPASIRSDAERTAGSLQPEPRREFRCVVVDPSGDPIEGARIERRDKPVPNAHYVQGGWPDWLPAWRQSGVDGQFSVAAERPSDLLYVAATHPDFVHVVRALEVRPGEDAELTMVRTATTTLEVTVADQDSAKPLMRFAVSGFQREDAFAEGCVEQTMLKSTARTSNGVVRMSHRFAVDRPLTVWLYETAGAGFGPQPESSWNQVTVDPIEGGLTRVHFDAQLDFPETSGTQPVARGSVVDDATGEPIQGVLVAALDKLPTGRINSDGEERWRHRSVASDAIGAFTIALPTDAPGAQVRLAHERYLPLEVQLVADPMAKQDFRLRRRGALSGVILDKAGSPVPGAPLLIRLPDHDDPVSRGRDSMRMLADADGRFEVTNLVAGRVFVYVLRQPRDADEHALTSSRFKMKAGQSRDVVVQIDRPERCHVTGEINGQSGQMTTHVPMFLPYSEEGGWTLAKASKYGFDAGGVERGRYLVALVPEEDGDTEAPVALLPDVDVSGLGAQRFTFMLPTSYLEGSVALPPNGRDTSEKPAGLRVLAVPTGLTGFAADTFGSTKAIQSFGVRVDATNGSFRIEHLSRGSHRLELWDTDPGATEPLAVRKVQVSGSRTLAKWVYQPK